MSPARPSRRALLTGAAGAVLGAAATELGDQLSSSGSGPGVGPPVPSPGEQLMTEHGFLKRILLAYRAASDQLTAGHIPPAGAILDAAQLVADFVESFHEGLEEAYVFPRVRDTQGALVQTLLVQHDRGRHLTARIRVVAAGDLSPAPARGALNRDLSLFVRMYEPHEAWEDTVLYPAFRAACSQRLLDETAQRFAELQDAQYGDDALAQLLGRLSGVEQQLGIADLASFTPPPS